MSTPIEQIMNRAGERTRMKVAEGVTRENKLKDMQSKALMDSITSGQLSPEESEAAWDEIGKIYGGNKSSKDVLLKAREVMGKLGGMLRPPPTEEKAVQGEAAGILGQLGTPAMPGTTPPFMPAGQAGQAQPTQPAAQPAQPTQDPQTAQAGAFAGTLPPPPWQTRGPIESAIPARPTAPDAPLPSPGAPPELPAPPITPAAPITPASITHKANPNPETAVVAKEQRANDEKIATEKRTNATQTARDLALHGYAKQIDKDRAAAALELEELKGMNAAAKTVPIRPVSAGQVSVPDARELAKQGIELLDEAGNPLPLDDLPDDMGLKPFTDGVRVFYTPFSPNQRAIAVGGKVYAVSPMEINSLASGGGTELGNSTVGTTSAREQITVGPDGNPMTTTLYTDRAPVTPGVQGRAGTAQAPQTPQTQPAARPQSAAPPAARPAAPATAPAASPTQTLNDNDVIGIPDRRTGRVIGMTPAMYNQAINRVTPVREAANQLFGDPTQPAFKGLKDYAHLADDKAASARISNAVRLTFDGIQQQEKTHGSIINLLKLYGGMPTALIAAEVSQMQDVVSALKPEEQEAYNAIMSSYGTVVGLRSLTRASAAQFSIQRLEQELPIPGWNSHTSRDFYDKLSRLAQEVYGGARPIPDSVMAPEEKAHYQNMPEEMLRLSRGTAIVPPPGARGGGGAGQPQPASNRVRVRGPNGETGTMDAGEPLPTGWTTVP